ncbi:MAG: transposase [Cytophagaceae bacterium]|nr:transposase [Cytophagaceae bacterium]MDW8456104.1 7TM diverse intracellular signaling domain-containing protein [Cytophagaceae bacterium]
MNINRKLLLLASFILFQFVARHAMSQRVLELNDYNEAYILEGDLLEIYEDKKRTLTFAEVSSPSFKGFVVNKKKHAYNENPSSAYWIRFRLLNKCRFDKSFILETYSPNTNHLQFYVPGPSNTYRLKEAGDNFKFHKREHLNKNLIFDLPVDDGENTQVYYLRVYSQNYSGFDFRIKSVNFFMHYITNEYYFLGMFYGILFIMAIYNFLFYFSVREKVYLYYVFYVACGMLSTMTEDGLGFQFLWSDYPHLIPFIEYKLVPSLLMLTFVMYSITFLDLKKNFPRERKILIYTVAGYFVYFIFTLTFIPSLSDLKFVYVIPFVVTYGIAVYCFKKGYKPARFFIVGYTFIFISIIVIQLRSMNILPGNILTVYSLNYGLVLEVVILSFALSDRVRIIKKEKEEAQRQIIEKLEQNKLLQEKVNRELEQKVAERTKELQEKNQELEDANQKLKLLNEKINEMNAKLDYDNWHLKKDLKEDLKARIIDAEVSYEEFSKIFPDEVTCFRYLEELKWSKGFKCRKCSNPKYTKGPKPFTRKCTRCGNVESTTAYTLFHGVRFDINKAFYMTYIIHRRGNKITLDELSQILSLRRNTCWSFKKKVLEHIEKFKSKNKDGRLESWEEIIL